MSKLAAIEGQLVSIKNVSTHKSGTLTIHIPEEEVLKAIQAFGWPTMAAPIHVAIAMIDPNAKPERKGGKLAQRAGILCNEAAFHKFIADKAPEYGLHNLSAESITPERAAIFIRSGCGIKSRADLDHDEEAASKFHDLELSYNAWKIAS